MATPVHEYSARYPGTQASPARNLSAGEPHSVRLQTSCCRRWGATEGKQRLSLSRANAGRRRSSPGPTSPQPQRSSAKMARKTQRGVGRRQLAVQLAVLLALAPPATATATIKLDRARYPIDRPSPVAVSAAAPLPPPPLFLTLRRDAKGGCFKGRSTSPGDAGFNCYANWAFRLPPIGDNFKRNQSYDFEAVPLSASGRGTLPRVATPGNSSACLSAADGTCLAGAQHPLLPRIYPAECGAVVLCCRQATTGRTSSILSALRWSLPTGPTWRRRRARSSSRWYAHAHPQRSTHHVQL